ncbi:MAG: hypothetical protein JWR83_2817 [Aeromicrobium sp.]|nr:hypothetical protein [Aeromicrobium sp.]
MVSSIDMLREQWNALRAWIAESGLLDHRKEQSVREAWNVHELVTHLGRGFLQIPLLGPARGQDPVSLRAFLSGYESAAGEIADGTKQLARSFSGNLLGGIDNCARIGFRALDALRVDIVQGPTGAISLDNFVVTRMIELVVHGDDLARSVPDIAAPPLLDHVVRAVSDAFVGVYVEATGGPPEIDDHLGWIRRASGRVPDPDAALPLL